VPLTDAEKELLKLHQGCFKCCIFYAEHISHNCTNLHPTPDNCKKVTPTCAAKAKVTYEKKEQGTMTMTTVFEAAAIFEEDISNDELDKFIDANEADEYMPPSLSFPPHLLWTCCVDAPATCAPTPMEALIDHGSATVLISSHIAEILCLMPRLLFKSLSVSGTFDKEKSLKSKQLVLTHYCRLHIQSPDAIWKSRTLNAVICLNLHTNIILGLDFLVKNKIIVDADLHTVIAKELGYDLLNLPNAKSNQELPIRSPHLQCKEEAQQIKSGQPATHKLRTLVHMELITLFEENFE